MSQSVEAWVIVFVAATALLALIQVVVLAGMALVMRRGFLEFRAFQRRLEEDGINPHQFVVQLHALLNDADKAVQKGMELGDSANLLINKSTSMLNHAEESVDSVRNFVDSKWATVLHGVAEPVYQFRAMAAGVRSLLGVLSHHGNGR